MSVSQIKTLPFCRDVRREIASFVGSPNAIILLSENLGEYKVMKNSFYQERWDVLKTSAQLAPFTSGVPEGLSYEEKVKTVVKMVLINWDNDRPDKSQVILDPSSACALIQRMFQSILFVSAHIAHLERVKVIHIRDASVVSLPKSLLKMPLLERLEFENNQIIEIPSFIDQMPKLKVLILNNNRVSRVPAVLERLVKSGLQCSLQKNPITEIDLSMLPQLHRITMDPIPVGLFVRSLGQYAMHFDLSNENIGGLFKFYIMHISQRLEQYKKYHTPLLVGAKFMVVYQALHLRVMWVR